MPRRREKVGSSGEILARSESAEYLGVETSAEVNSDEPGEVQCQRQSIQNALKHLNSLSAVLANPPRAQLTRTTSRQPSRSYHHVVSRKEGQVGWTWLTTTTVECSHSRAPAASSFPRRRHFAQLVASTGRQPAEDSQGQRGSRLEELAHDCTG